MNPIQQLKTIGIKNKASVILLFLLMLCTVVKAQDLEQIGKKDAIKMNGSLSLMNIFYAADGIQNRRPPSTWFINGHVPSICMVGRFSFNDLSRTTGLNQPLINTGITQSIGPLLQISS